jgi:hypothetical protein
MLNTRQVVNGAWNHFRVSAVNKSGGESLFSNEETLFVDIIQPGQNAVANPAFAEGEVPWTLQVRGNAAGQFLLQNGAASLSISNAGSLLGDLQLRQGGIRLIQGKPYQLEFDAWTTRPRFVEARITSSNVPPVNYAPSQPVQLTPVRSRFLLKFEMTSPTDLNAVLQFHFGGNGAPVFLDDVSLVFRDKADLTGEGTVDARDLERFAREWLKPGATADLDGSGFVNFSDLGELGNYWQSPSSRWRTNQASIRAVGGQ